MPESSDVLLPHTLHFICITSMMTLVFLLLEKPKSGKNIVFRINTLLEVKLDMVSIKKSGDYFSYVTEVSSILPRFMR